jgi:hypothetical protein
MWSMVTDDLRDSDYTSPGWTEKISGKGVHSRSRMPGHPVLVVRNKQGWQQNHPPRSSRQSEQYS